VLNSGFQGKMEMKGIKENRQDEKEKLEHFLEFCRTPMLVQSCLNRWWNLSPLILVMPNIFITFLKIRESFV